MDFNNFDAQAALGFVLSQTSHIEQEVYRIRYPDIQYPQVIPVDTSANPFAKTVTYYSSDKFGKAEWINGNADDVPLAGTERSKHETTVYTAAIGYSYGWEEVAQAQWLGINLPNEDAMAARRAYEEMVDRVAIEGDTEKGFEGLINHSAVTPVSATNGDWTASATTEDQMLGDVNDIIQKVDDDTNTVEMADTVLLSPTRLNLIASTRMVDTSMTVLEFLRQNNIFTATTGAPLMIRALRGLEDAGVSSDQRMIAYRRSPEVLKLHIPMPHRFMPVFQSSGLRYEVPGVFRLGGLDIRLPKAVAYADGI